MLIRLPHGRLTTFTILRSYLVELFLFMNLELFPIFGFVKATFSVINFKNLASSLRIGPKLIA